MKRESNGSFPLMKGQELNSDEGAVDPHAQRTFAQNIQQNFIPSSEILATYGEWKVPSLDEAKRDYEVDHGFHKDFPLYQTKPFELRVFGKGCMLYFFWLRYMALVMGIMALICGFPNTVIFLSGVWYNYGGKGLEPSTIGNYGLVSSNLGGGNLSILFYQNPNLSNCTDPNFVCYNVSSGNDFGASRTYQKEMATLALFRADYPYPNGTSPAALDSSISGGLNKQSTIVAMSVLDLLSCILFFGFCLFFVVKTRRLALKADLGTCTIEDYSVRVQNLPPDVTHDELMEHFQEFGQVARVDRCHAISELMSLVRQRRKILDKLEKDIALLQKAAMKDDKVPESLETEVLETKYDLALCKSAIRAKQMDKKDDGVSDVVEAYIVFEDEEAKARALKSHHSHSGFYRGLKSMLGMHNAPVKGFERHGAAHGHRIVVTEAPEPSDLIYENLEVDIGVRRAFGVLSWSLKALVLVIGFLGTSLAPALKLSLGAWNGGPEVATCNSYCTYINDNGTPVLNTTGPSANLLRQDNFYRSCSPSCPSGKNCADNSSSVISYGGLSATCGNQTICYECFCRLTVGAGDVSQALYCSPWASVLGIQVGAQALSVLAIVIVNLILPLVIEFLSSIEWHTTNSSKSRSVARALIIMFFLNTAVSIIVANAYLPGIRNAMKGSPASKYLLLGIFPDLTPNWFKEVGSALLLSQLTGILVRMAIPISLQLLRWWNVRREVRHQEASKKKAEEAFGHNKLMGKTGLPSTDSLYLTQRQLNESFEGADFTLAEKYGMHMGVVFITMFFGGTMPLAYLISCCSFSSVYWIEKNFLLRFCKRPIAYNEDLAVLVSELMPWATFWHLIFAAWSFSMIAVPRSVLVNDSVKEVINNICYGLRSVWANTNGLTPAQMSDRLSQSNSFHLLIFIFIFALALIAFSIVDEFSYFFGPLFRRVVRKIKKFTEPATNNVVVGGLVSGAKNVAGAAKGAANLAASVATAGVDTVAKAGKKAAKNVKKAANQAAGAVALAARGNQVSPSPLLSDEEQNLAKRENQRLDEEALLDQAVEAHLRALEDQDDADFDKALDAGKGDPEIGASQSAQLAAKLQGIYFMPRFSEAIAQGKLVGQATYHVEDAPLYADAFVEDDEDKTAETEGIASKLSGRVGKVGRARKLLRKQAASILNNGSVRAATGAFKKIAQVASKLPFPSNARPSPSTTEINRQQQRNELMAMPTPQISTMDAPDASSSERPGVAGERLTESRAGRSDRVGKTADIPTVAEEEN